MPSRTDGGVSQAEAVSLATEFWTRFRDAQSAVRIQEIREMIKTVSVTEAFSFELLEQDDAEGEGTSAASVQVEPGTPKPLLDAWNSNKVVGLFVLEAEDSCLAAVGQDVKPSAVDFKVCALSLSGDNLCEYAMHKGPRAKRMSPLKGKFALAIPVSFDARKRVTVIFSRPTLEASMFLHMPPDSEGFKLLLEIKLEPRVWKFLFVHFPGPGVFAPSDEAVGQSLTPRPKDILSTPRDPPLYLYTDNKPSAFARAGTLVEVTDQPIFSPIGVAAIASSGLQSFQTAQQVIKEEESVGGWSNTSVSLSRGSRSTSHQNKVQRDHPVERFLVGLDRQGSAAGSRASSGGRRTTPSAGSRSRGDGGFMRYALPNYRRMNSNSDSEVTQGEDDFHANEVSDLRARLDQFLEYDAKRDQQLKTILTTYSARFHDYEIENRNLRKELKSLKGNISSSRGRTSLSPNEIDQLALDVYAKLDWDRIVSQEDLNRLKISMGTDPGLVAKVESAHRELNDPAGVFSTLANRVTALEASKSSTAVDLGGYIFRDEAAVEAFSKVFNDPSINRFVVDPIILFILSEPKYETVSQGLAQTANALKAGFQSLDRAAIDLSYQLKYPDAILAFSKKDDAASTQGVVWAQGFHSHAIFDGSSGSGTKLSMQQSLDTTVRTIQAGIDYYFPAKSHPKANAIFTAQLRLSADQTRGLLDCLTPLFNKICQEGAMSHKEAWHRVMLFVKQLFDKTYLVRRPNSEASTGSMMWGSFRTTQTWKAYHDVNFIDHSDVAICLTFASMKKEGTALSDLSSKLSTLDSTVGNHAKSIRTMESGWRELKAKNPALF